MLTSVKFTELCAFDSESSEKKILSSKCVFLFRSSNVTDRWLCLSPPQHGPHDCLPQRLFVRVFFDGNLCSCDITCVCGSLVGRLLVLDRYTVSSRGAFLGTDSNQLSLLWVYRVQVFFSRPCFFPDVLTVKAF